MADIDARPPPVAVGRRTWRRRWRRAAVAGSLVIAGLVVFVLVWFQPQRLIIDDRVDQAIPTSTSAPPGEGEAGGTRDSESSTGQARRGGAGADGAADDGRARSGRGGYRWLRVARPRDAGHGARAGWLWSVGRVHVAVLSHAAGEAGIRGLGRPSFGQAVACCDESGTAGRVASRPCRHARVHARARRPTDPADAVLTSG